MSFLYNMNMIVGLISGCLGLHAKGAARVVISVWMLESFLSSTGMVCEFVNTVYCKKKCLNAHVDLINCHQNLTVFHLVVKQTCVVQTSSNLTFCVYLFIYFLLFRRTATPAGKRLQQTDPAGWEMNTHTHSATLNYWGGGAFPKCSQSAVSSEHAVHSILIILAFGTLYICPLIPEKIMWSHVLQDSKNTNTYNSNSTNIK